MRGSTSIDTEPSTPFDASYAGFSTSHASRMSSRASEKKILLGSSVSASSRFRSSSYASPVESAFWKIVGFDVTPVTASSSIIRFSSPVLTRSRESVSNHTACPCSVNSCSRDFATLHHPFHLCDLQQPRHIALAAVECCVQKRRDQLARKRRADDLGAETEDVHVVVLHALMGAVAVVADRCADARELAGGDRGADTGPADEHGTLRVAALDRLADLAGLVGVVDPHRVGVGAQVDHVVVRERLHYRVAQMNAAVVERHRHLHRTSTRAIFPSSKVNRRGSVRPSACTIAIAWPSWRTSIPCTATDGSSPSSVKPGETSARNCLIASASFMPHAPGGLRRGPRRCPR